MFVRASGDPRKCQKRFRDITKYMSMDVDDEKWNAFHAEFKVVCEKPNIRGKDYNVALEEVETNVNAKHSRDDPAAKIAEMLVALQTTLAGIFLQPNEEPERKVPRVDGGNAAAVGGG